MDHIYPILCCDCPIFSCVYHFLPETHLLFNNSTCITFHNICIHILQGLQKPPQINPILYLDLKLINPKTILPEPLCTKLVYFLLHIICIFEPHFVVDGFFFWGVIVKIFTKVYDIVWEMLSTSEDLFHVTIFPGVNSHIHVVI